MNLKSYRPSLFLSLSRSNNNFFVSLSLGNNPPFFTASAGVLGLSGSRRDTPTSAQLVGKAVAKKIITRGYTRFYLRVASSFDPTIKGFLRGLKQPPLKILKLYHLRPATHNGIRLRKPRRM